ncbi:MAG TPA: mechanosensitive ion channel domain-containing protein [Alphaproteobacteria bacterium]|nr:mechanosensitive ion channel domain-containing protein [Alphaproteobacteria bacterium]
METQALTPFQNIAALATKYAFDLVGAVIILVIGWLLASWAERGTRRGLARLTHIDPTLKPLLASIVRAVILVFVAIAVLAQFGVQVASVIAVLGAAGVAIALALQGTLSNVAAGVMLLALRPFRVGEFIDAGAISGVTVTGTVEIIGLFTTEIRTAQGLYLSTPNAQLWNRPIKNYSRLPTRRLDLTVSFSGGELDTAIGALRELVEGDPRVRKEPPPDVLVTAIADGTVTLALRCWAARADHPALLHDLHNAVRARLSAAGIAMPGAEPAIHGIAWSDEDRAP